MEKEPKIPESNKASKNIEIKTKSLEEEKIAKKLFQDIRGKSEGDARILDTAIAELKDPAEIEDFIEELSFFRTARQEPDAYEEIRNDISKLDEETKKPWDEALHKVLQNKAKIKSLSGGPYTGGYKK